MAAFILTDAEVYADSVDLTGYTNMVQVSETVDVKDATTFAQNGWAENKAGRKSAMFNVSGFLDWPSPGTNLTNNVGSAQTWVIAATDDPAGGGLGGQCWAGSMLTDSFEQTVDHGDLGKYTVNASTYGAYGAGTLVMTPTAFSGSVNSLIANVAGGVLAGEHLGLALNVFTAGTTATVTLKSSAVIGMTSPTNRIVATVTATGGQVLTLPGAVTDPYYRVDVSAVTGSFLMAAAVFVQK